MTANKGMKISWFIGSLILVTGIRWILVGITEGFFEYLLIGTGFAVGGFAFMMILYVIGKKQKEKEEEMLKESLKPHKRRRKSRRD